MTEQYDETWQHDDMDSDITYKQELIEKIKTASEELTGDEAVRQANALRKEWRRIHYWESSYEDELENQFNEYADKIFASLDSAREAAKARKEELIEEAKKLSQAENFKNTLPAMNALMDQWKQAGFAGRETDNALWEQFQAARQVFYDRRRQHQKELQKHYAEVRAAKEELIQKAESLMEPSEWNSATNQMNELMEEWKKAGYAGRDHDSKLWESFNGLRKQFFAARSAYFSDIRKQHQKSAAVKRDLIAEAKDILDSNDFSRENIDKMKNMSVRWKEAGFAGKDYEDNLWTEYRKVADEFFGEVKERRDQQHQDWIYRMEDAKERKKDLINDQKRRIRRMEDELNGLISQGRAEEIEDMIADKESFIAQLESEIEEIDRKIGN